MVNVALEDFFFSGGVSMNSASIDNLAQMPSVDEIIIPQDPADVSAALILFLLLFKIKFL